MTWASHEFKRIVQKNRRMKLPRDISIAIWVIIVLCVLFLVSSSPFVLDNVYKKERIIISVILYLMLIGAVLCYILLIAKRRLPAETYTNQIRNGLVCDVKREMAQLQLPLEKTEEFIRNELKAELERIQKENERYIDFAKKVWAGIVCAPFAFLLTLLLQVVFSKELLLEGENLIGATKFLMQLFWALVILAALVTVVYRPARDAMKWITGEIRLRYCLDVLEEIRLAEKCNGSSPDTRVNQAAQTAGATAQTP